LSRSKGERSRAPASPSLLLCPKHLAFWPPPGMMKALAVLPLNGKPDLRLHAVHPKDLNERGHG
jgi:hypothetical protein